MSAAITVLSPLRGSRSAPWFDARRAIVCSFGLLAVPPGVAGAQWSPGARASVSHAVHVHVGTVLRLALDGAATVRTAADRAVIAQGVAAARGPSAVIGSNGRWGLEISADATVWTATGDSARRDKPASDLSWSTNPATGFTPVGLAPARVATGGATDGVVLPLYYRTRFTPGSDTPGTYALTVRLTLVGA